MCSCKNSSVGLSGGECVAGVSEINEVCNGLSKSVTWYLWQRTPPVYGEWCTRLTHVHIHTHITVYQTSELQVGFKMAPTPPNQCQNNRWIGIFFMMSAVSMCTFQGEQHETSEFPARNNDREPATIYFLVREILTKFYLIKKCWISHLTFEKSWYRYDLTKPKTHQQHQSPSIATKS